MIAVVAGDRLAASRCSKRAVRNIQDISEAKWADFTRVQKRRLMECLQEQNHLSYGYSTFDKRHLHSLENYHLLYDDVSFPPDWDLALIGYAYGEILFELGALDDNLPVFSFDRVASQNQSDAIVEHVHQFVPRTDVFYEGSRQSYGIQTADCIAGAVREDITRGSDWLSYLSNHETVEARSATLIQLERDLSEYNTGP